MNARHGLARQIGTLQANRAPEFHQGVVQSLQAGPPKTLTAQINGSSNNTPNIRYLASYTPVAGDHVLLLLLGSDSRARQSWLAVGALA